MPRGDTEPLLPRYEDETSRRRQLHPKLHTYQMFRALSEGYMPSTEQAIANLRTLLALDILSPRNEDLSAAGRQLVRDCRLSIQLLIELLREKNGQDQIQEFLWHLARSRASLDAESVSARASQASAKRDTKAAYDSFRIVGNLLLTNADFRLFVDDLTTIGRQIFSDTALSLSQASKQVSREIKPSEQDLEAISGAGADSDKAIPSDEAIRQGGEEIAKLAGDGLARTGHDAVQSARDNLTGGNKDALFYRLKQTVLNLRERTEYSDSVATLARLVQRYAQIYSTVAEDTISAVHEDVDVNADLREAVRGFWAVLRQFGDAEEWSALEKQFHTVIEHANRDPEFEALMSEMGTALQRVMTDPDFLDSEEASDKVDELRGKTKQLGSESTLRQDMDAFLEQTKRTLRTVPDDPSVSKLVDVARKMGTDLYAATQDQKTSLLSDLSDIFLPLLIRSVQFIPIPRLEISSPELDLLVENLILEPGHSINFSSFLPYRVHMTTRNDIDVTKKHSKRVVTDTQTTFTVTVCGLNVSAEEFGYWLRAHAGLLLHVKDEGIASFHLDRRGIDISLDVQIGRDRLGEIFSLRGVRVRIHKLDYTLHRSRWSILLWLAKPFLKQLIRRVLEKQIAEQIVAAATALNRELVFARERIRAARIANPHDLASFIRAVLARLKPRPNPDISARVGLYPPREGVFHGVYAPGSLVKMWHDEAELAQDAIDEGDHDGGLRRTWRNDVFDVAR